MAEEDALLGDFFSEVNEEETAVKRRAEEDRKRKRREAEEKERDRVEREERLRKEEEEKAKEIAAGERQGSAKRARVDELPSALGASSSSSSTSSAASSSAAAAVAGTASQEEEEVQARRQLTQKYQQDPQESSEEIVARLLEDKYEWRNLNPYFVLGLDVDATLDDIKVRYRKLSRKVHPDKCLRIERARDAFEQVKTAYNVLLDDDKRGTCIRNIEVARADAVRERKLLVKQARREQRSRGGSGGEVGEVGDSVASEEEDFPGVPSLDELVKRKTLERFATIEYQRRKAEQNLRANMRREEAELEEQERWRS